MWTPVLALRDKHNAVEEADKYHTIFFGLTCKERSPFIPSRSRNVLSGCHH